MTQPDDHGEGPGLVPALWVALPISAAMWAVGIACARAAWEALLS